MAEQEAPDLREQVAELAKAVEALTEKLSQHCCSHHNCWHYYQYPVTYGASTVYPYTVTTGSNITYTGGSSGSIGSS